MTEQEWLSSADYLAMLIFLRGNITPRDDGFTSGFYCGDGYLADGDAEHVSSRKLRLINAAMCREWSTIPLDELSQQFLVAYERFVEERSHWSEVHEVGSALHRAILDGQRPAITHMAMAWGDTPCGVSALGQDLAHTIAYHVAQVPVAILMQNASQDELESWGWGAGPPDPLWQATRKRIEAKFPDILREIIGNPYRPITVAPDWLTWNEGTIPRIAQTIQCEQRFGYLPILADALEEAGCTSADVLQHCRNQAEHLRGCWVVDLMLNKH